MKKKKEEISIEGEGLMELDEIKKIVQLMDENNLVEFEMEREGFKISLKKAQSNQGTAQLITQQPAQFAQMPQNTSPPVQEAAPSQKAAEEEIGENIETIASPMVGTFYAAPSPESAPYVTVGQEIDADDVVCILEAMKVMNEIKAEVSGKIIEVLVENGEPVEFGQSLFKVQTKLS